MTAPSTAAGVDWEGQDWRTFRTVADLVQERDPERRWPYWRCQVCLGPSFAGQWQHEACSGIVLLGQVTGRLLALADGAADRARAIRLLPDAPDLRLAANAYSGMAERIRDALRGEG